MNADERVFARYLLVRLCGAAEAKARFGINNSEVVEKKIADARTHLASVDNGCVDTVRKISRVAIKSPKKGGRVPWAKKEHVANAFVAEVQKTVLVLYYLLKEKMNTKQHSFLKIFALFFLGRGEK